MYSTENTFIDIIFILENFANGANDLSFEMDRILNKIKHQIPLAERDLIADLRLNNFRSIVNTCSYVLAIMFSVSIFHVAKNIEINEKGREKSTPIFWPHSVQTFFGSCNCKNNFDTNCHPA